MSIDALTERSETPDCSVRHPLDVLFAPESVAIFGATERPGSVGRTLTFNLLHSPFGGVLYPISLHRHSVLGIRAYPSLDALPEVVDLAVVATPAPAVPDILAECLAAGVKTAIVLSAGFGDSGPAGAELERQIREVLRPGSMRVLGLGSFGVACPRTGFNATSAPGALMPGNVGFLTQSGALLTALLKQEHSEHVGCSVAVSTGSLIDISWTEWLDYLGQDEHTRCISIYVEYMDDARSFFMAAREVAGHKPIILIKSGRSPEHPARGDDPVFDEACRSNGILRVDRFADLFRLAAHLTSNPVPRGRRLAILSNARGPAVLAADAARSEGACLAPLADRTVRELGEVLTPRWNQENPIDVGSDSNATRLARAAAVASDDPNTDGLLVLLAPQATMDPVAAAAGLRGLSGACRKPVLACWMWEAASSASLAALRDAGISTFHSPESAIRTFGYLCQHVENLRFLVEIRAALDAAEEEAVQPARAAGIVAAAHDSGRVFLTPAEVEEVFSAYGLPILSRACARDAGEAVEAASALGYPVLVELDEGERIRLQATDAGEVRRAVASLQLLAREHFGMTAEPRLAVVPFIPAGAVEAAVSSAVCRDLGPVIALAKRDGLLQTRGGAIQALAPLTPLTVREMIERSSLTAAGASSPGVVTDFEPLERFLLRLSRLAIEQSGIREILIPSLLLWDRRVMAREVRISTGQGAAASLPAAGGRGGGSLSAMTRPS
jgi:acetyltransferase